MMPLPHKHMHACSCTHAHTHTHTNMSEGSLYHSSTGVSGACFKCCFPHLEKAGINSLWALSPGPKCSELELKLELSREVRREENGAAESLRFTEDMKPCRDALRAKCLAEFLPCWPPLGQAYQIGARFKKSRGFPLSVWESLFFIHFYLFAQLLS